ncbi:MAG TPA: enoyl-CoA hydratase-related protein [Conexibacter sp.]|jgi:enoyl-CoA hydratase
MSDALVTAARAGAIVTLALNRPEKRNALNDAMLEQLSEQIALLAHDRAAHVVVLGASGDHFCAGFDLDTVRSDETSEDRMEREREHLFELALALRDVPQPTIAAVQGACVAAGLLLSQSCDLVVAADDAFFYNPLPRMGGVGLELLLEPWDMGTRLAKRYLFTGERIPAADALRLGMVTDLAPRAELDGKVAELSERVAAMPPVTLRLLKRSLNRTQDLMGMRDALEHHFALHHLGHASAESRALLHEARRGRPLKEYFEKRDEGQL